MIKYGVVGHVSATSMLPYNYQRVPQVGNLKPQSNDAMDSRLYYDLLSSAVQRQEEFIYNRERNHKSLLPPTSALITFLRP
jgi:hypothetical protein